MKIALIGQAAFAEKALEVLHARGEQIVHVFAPPDSPGGRPDPLKTRAVELGIPLSQPKSFRGEEAYQHFKSLDADLAILAFVTIIVPERILYAPRFKSICFHPSLLPRHRGASAINWAIIQGDTETGVTWFWPDKGIDTGPILIRRGVPIAEQDTTGSIYFNHLFRLGIETMVEAVEQIKAGTAPAIPQDEKLASYEPPCRDEHAKLDFQAPARQVYNLVRGCDPQPGADAQSSAGRLRLYEPAFEEKDSGAAPGTIVSVGSAGMWVALRGATLLIRRVRLEPNRNKVAPAELAGSDLIKAGAILQ
ncbi:MAG: methionyl-tRNA formyltransferase [Candidatus Binataceae bacterium]